MKIGIISDTHGRLTETQWAVDLFKEQGVSAVIHCGDIGSVSVVHAFRGIETHFVYGNTDGENVLLHYAAEEDGNHHHHWCGSVKYEGKKIFFLHGHQSERFEQEINSGNWDLICFGHTHQPAFELYGSTLILNPGALYRVAAPSVAVLTLPEMTVERFSI
ncbi:MAG: YfcE family phosphodiesterase [Planctomycetaceae bacterium]|jgi:putative phosphoesterase|nr:YfcE family phosphodiesterase [Planctomycetaceae bacterium]